VAAAGRFKPYPAYKDSGVEWLGEIPVGWEVKRLRSTLTSCQNGAWGDEPDGVHAERRYRGKRKSQEA
jgi:type I restriction enzyme S subunit